MTSNHSEFAQRDKNAPDEKVTVYNKSLDAEDILSELNQDKVLELLPIIIIVSCLMVFGLIGNTSVLLFFRRKARKDTPSFFIMTLAVVDWIVCLDISLTIMELVTIYSFKNSAACKIYVFTKMFAALFSSFILLTIAAYRYRKICCPFKRQLTLKGARIAVGCNLLLALLLSFPQLFLFGSVSEHLPNDYNVTVIGFDCSMKIFDDKLTVLNAFMSYTYVTIFTIAFVALIVMYGLQGKAISKFNKDHLTLKSDGRDTRTTSRSQSLDSVAKLGSIPRTVQIRNCAPSEILPLTNVMNNGPNTTQTDSDEDLVLRRNKTVNHSQDKHTSVIISQGKITIMFLIITMCFMFSFLPYLSYSLWRKFNISGTDAFTRDTIKVQFCLNSYLINSVVNPIVYGFFHIEFREYIKRILFKCCRSRMLQFQDSSQ